MIRFSSKVAVFATALLIRACALAVDNKSSSSILDQVKNTGTIACGVIREEEDYSKADTHGNRAALDRDVCKALSASILGDKGKVVLATFPDEPSAIKALSEGKIEVIATATPTFLNSVAFHIDFSPVLFFDGQGFLVKKADGITSAKELADKKVCFIDETTNAVNLQVDGKRENIKFFPFPFEEQGEMEAAMYTANCAAMTTDITQLANTRARFGPRAKEFELLPQLISKDPLAVAYKSGDPQWSAVVDWTVSAIIQAEESGVTAANVDNETQMKSPDPAVQLYFGSASKMAALLGLDPAWAVRAVKAVGNYGELYRRDLGDDSPLKIPRGINALWDKGGIIYVAPAKK